MTALAPAITSSFLFNYPRFLALLLLQRDSLVGRIVILSRSAAGLQTPIYGLE